MLQARHMQMFWPDNIPWDISWLTKTVDGDVLLKHPFHQQQAKHWTTSFEITHSAISSKFLTFGPSSRTKRERENGTPGCWRVLFILAYKCLKLFNMKHVLGLALVEDWKVKIWNVQATKIIPRVHVALQIKPETQSKNWRISRGFQE